MIRLTKVFSFEAAHAIHGYNGDCKDIHGHSYELHVSVAAAVNSDDYLPAPGIAIDFKEIKRTVTEVIIKQLDHKLILSEQFIAAHPAFPLPGNLVKWKMEPTSENILIYIKKSLDNKLPPGITLAYLKLRETRDSYAELFAGNSFNEPGIN